MSRGCQFQALARNGVPMRPHEWSLLAHHWAVTLCLILGRKSKSPPNPMTLCPSCESPVTPVDRWCPHCSANVLKLEVGFLASPARRLAAYILDIAIPAFVTIVMVAGAAGAAAASEGQEPTNESLAAGLIPLAALAAYLITAIIMFFRGTTPGLSLIHI